MVEDNITYNIEFNLEDYKNILLLFLKSYFHRYTKFQLLS